MQNYRRHTYECEFHELQADLIEVFREHFMKYAIAHIERDMLICCETASYNRKVTGLLGKVTGGDPDPVHYSAIIITPEWFVGARTGSQSGTYTVSARLADIGYNISEMQFPEPNLVLVVFGFMTDIPQPIESIWGLGQGRATDRLLAVLGEAVAKVRTDKVDT